MPKKELTPDQQEKKEIEKRFGGYCNTCCKPVLLLTKDEILKKSKPIKRASAKAKGMGAQRDLADALALALNLDKEDIWSNSGGQTGVDLRLSPKARGKFPFHAVECANQQNINVWAKFNQACRHCVSQKIGKTPGNGAPILIFKRNGSEFYTMLKLSDFLELIKLIPADRLEHIAEHGFDG